MDVPVRQGRAAASPPAAEPADPAPKYDRARFRRLFVAVMVPMFREGDIAGDYLERLLNME